MTNNNTQQLREANNEVNITGVLNEKNLEVRELTKDGDKYNAMMGTLDIRTGEHEVHKVRFFAREFTNAGKENQQYKALHTIMDEYVSIADLADKKEDESGEELKPSEINIVGRLELNEFYGQDGQLRQYEQVGGRFANRLREQDDNTPKAEFDVEGIVKRVIEEFDKDEQPTDRAKIELLVPLYGGRVIPMNFVVDNEQGGKDYVMDSFEQGSSVRLYGEIKNIREEKERRIPMGFGEDKIEVDVTYVNENSVQGGSVYEESVHDSKIFDLTLLKDANVEREKYLEGLKTRAEQRQAQGGAPRTGFGSGQPNKRPAGKSNAEKLGVDLEGLF